MKEAIMDGVEERISEKEARGLDPKSVYVVEEIDGQGETQTMEMFSTASGGWNMNERE